MFRGKIKRQLYSTYISRLETRSRSESASACLRISAVYRLKHCTSYLSSTTRLASLSASEQCSGCSRMMHENLADAQSIGFHIDIAAPSPATSTVNQQIESRCPIQLSPAARDSSLYIGVVDRGILYGEPTNHNSTIRRANGRCMKWHNIQLYIWNSFRSLCEIRRACHQ